MEKPKFYIDCDFDDGEPFPKIEKPTPHPKPQPRKETKNDK